MWTVPSLKETLLDLAWDEESAAADEERQAARAHPERARELHSFAAHRRRLADRARGLAWGLEY